jgi:hypothetical protein
LLVFLLCLPDVFLHLWQMSPLLKNALAVLVPHAGQGIFGSARVRLALRLGVRHAVVSDWLLSV